MPMASAASATSTAPATTALELCCAEEPNAQQSPSPSACREASPQCTLPVDPTQADAQSRSSPSSPSASSSAASSRCASPPGLNDIAAEDEDGTAPALASVDAESLASSPACQDCDRSYLQVAICPAPAEAQASPMAAPPAARATALPMVNRANTFPLPPSLWKSFCSNLVAAHPDLAATCSADASKESAEAPPVPRPPIFGGVIQSADVCSYLYEVQAYLCALQYNHTGYQFFEIEKHKPLRRLMEVAKQMVHYSLPIRCLEAVILATYLTAALTSVQRFTISFKTAACGQHHKHVVLGIFVNGKFGALGLSRRSTLMDKAFRFASLSDLIQDYMASYRQVHHSVLRVRIGRPISHDCHSASPIMWRYLVIRPMHIDWALAGRALDNFTKSLRSGTFANSTIVLGGKAPVAAAEADQSTAAANSSAPSQNHKSSAAGPQHGHDRSQDYSAAV